MHSFEIKEMQTVVRFTSVFSCFYFSARIVNSCVACTQRRVSQRFAEEFKVHAFQNVLYNLCCQVFNKFLLVVSKLLEKEPDHLHQAQRWMFQLSSAGA